MKTNVMMAVMMALFCGITSVAAGVAISHGDFEIIGENVSLKSLDVRGQLSLTDGNLSADENLTANSIKLETGYGKPVSILEADNITTEQLSNGGSKVVVNRLKTNGLWNGGVTDAGEADIVSANIGGGSKAMGNNWSVKTLVVDTGATLTAKNLTAGPTTIETGAVITADNATLNNTSMCCGAVLRSLTDGVIKTKNLDACCGAQVKAGEYTGENVNLSAGAQITAKKTIEAKNINLTAGGACVAPNINAEDKIVARHLSVSGDRVVASG